ncbi:hypothetical protein NQ315_017494 [Exocentrus adspersus]|uniref:PiggyBac transposable element-derived protein domain-containing protein n=1 Tax=Exocentrus adspersus TaxID=1586481 RepID=A0AAV8VJQ6_9CUCU|nr:hypothetical protein NQ315_017494 [Exocentrus adspersus]
MKKWKANKENAMGVMKTDAMGVVTVDAVGVVTADAMGVVTADAMGVVVADAVAYVMDEFQSVPPIRFYGSRHKHLGTPLEEISCQSSRQATEIVIIPPDVDDQTDEENIDDGMCEEENLVLPNDVAGEIELHYESSGEDTDDESSIPLSILRERLVKAPRNCQSNNFSEPVWTNNDINIEMQKTLGVDERARALREELVDLNPVEIFEKLFTEEIINHIVSETNKYSTQKNNHSFFVSSSDIKIFIGILLVTGYHKVPRERMYWSLDEDLMVSFISKAMSRNRFQDIKRYIHLSDNSSLDKNDKMAKVRPHIKFLNQSYQQWGIFHEFLAVDEAMIKFYGRHTAKQFIRGKPVRFGYKNWELCSSDGYCYAFDTYCGSKKKNEAVASTRSTLPLGSEVVLDLLDIIAVPSDHTIFFDNFFSSHRLLDTLRHMGYRATGTIRDNRTKKCPLTDIKQFKKKDRGCFEHIYDENAKLLFVRWLDNSVVTMVTNYDTVEPLGKVKRWSPIYKEKVDVPQPHLIQNYNRFMGGCRSIRPEYQ